MTTQTADEMRDQRLSVMGQELGAVYHALWSHVVELHGELEEFRKLYGSPEASALLNDTAGSLFRTIRRVLWEHLLLYVARVTDKVESCGHPNLTVKQLPALITDPTLKQEIEALLAGADEPKWEPVRTLRNKWLAHLDLHVWTDDPRAAPLPDMNDAAVESALSSLRDVLTQIEQKYFGPADRRYVPIRLFGDADRLLFWLRRAVKVEKQRRERILSGNALPGDFDET